MPEPPEMVFLIARIENRIEKNAVDEQPNRKIDYTN